MGIMAKALIGALGLAVGAAVWAAKPPAVSLSVPAGWTEDFEAAKKRAAAEKKKMLVVFSGSDWCGWCVKFERDVLSKPEFTGEATNKFVLVMIDLPSDKSRLSELAKKQNTGLARKYEVRGFPAWKVTDAEGKTLYNGSGYVRGGPKALLERINAVK